jgi:hypothetical protein
MAGDGQPNDQRHDLAAPGAAPRDGGVASQPE